MILYYKRKQLLHAKEHLERQTGAYLMPMVTLKKIILICFDSPLIIILAEVIQELYDHSFDNVPDPETPSTGEKALTLPGHL